MKSIKLIVLGITISSSFYASANRISKEDYVNQWEDVAVEQMIRYQIPASITMAQAILESGSGNSKLALKGNNHFGIKCHGWKGKKMYIDDDREDECFRVYKSASESFEDHSLFLTSYKRYAFLFDYNVEDYKSWAHGLKKAGYATNPKYPTLLIEIIEDLKLYELGQTPQLMDYPGEIIAYNDESKEVNKVLGNVHTPRLHERGIKYVVAEKGDTYFRIAEEFGLTLRQLYRYNDYKSKKEVLEIGDYVFIQPKKRRSLFSEEVYTVKKSISINELAQLEATSAKSIRKLNKYTEEINEIAPGEKVTLR